MARGLLGIASVIALLTLLSKGFGFGRELVIAYQFGAGVAKDAYTAAYIIPAFSLIMLGGLTGPFHTVTQRILATLRHRGEDAAIPGVMAAIFVVVTAVMGGLAALTYFASPLMIKAVASQLSGPAFEIAVLQLQLMSPLVLLGGLIGILCGISNDRGDFTLPSLSPLVASLAIIAVVLLKPDPLALAWGTLLGGVGQLLLQAPAAIKLLGSPAALAMDFRHPEVLGLWRLLLPASVSQTIGTINVIIGTNFASSLPTGSLSVFDYANKLVQLPLGILMTALLIPLFPLLTKAAVAGDEAGLAHWMNRGLSTIALATLPLMALFVAAGEPLVAVLYERGAFDAAATRMTYGVLAVVAASILAYAARDLFIRVFYALDDSRTPLLVSVLSIATTTAFMAVAIGPFGLLGLAGATAGVTIFNCLLIGYLLKRKLGILPIGPSVALTGKAFAAAVLACAAAWAAALPVAWQDGFIWDLARLVWQSAVLGLVYVLLLMIFRVPVLAGLSQVASRFRKKGGQAVGQSS